MKILFLGDIAGKPGVYAVQKYLESEKNKYDFIIANAENATAGRGLAKNEADLIFSAGVHAVTMGNHVWDNKEFAAIANENRFVRPANYPAGTPGKGYRLFQVKNRKIGVINLLGSIFMDSLVPPFQIIDKLLQDADPEAAIIVDIHAEATSEKKALGFYLDGRVSAVAGTHTHIQTADEQILPGGTAYITDIGMCGSNDSVLGIKKEIAIKKFLTKMPVRFEVSDSDLRINAISMELDNQNFCTNISRIQVQID